MSLRSEVVALLNPTVGNRVYADQAPDNAQLPYIVVFLDIYEAPILNGDLKARATTRGLQVDLWESRGAEDDALRDAVWAALDGVRLVSALRLHVQSAPRVPDPDYDLVHRAFTVDVAQLRH